MARPKRGDEQRQKALYLLDNFGVPPQRVIPPKCTTAKEVNPAPFAAIIGACCVGH
jgi:hypothetical protein